MLKISNKPTFELQVKSKRGVYEVRIDELLYNKSRDSTANLITIIGSILLTVILLVNAFVYYQVEYQNYDKTIEEFNKNQISENAMSVEEIKHAFRTNCIDKTDYKLAVTPVNPEKLHFPVQDKDYLTPGGFVSKDQTLSSLH